MSIFENPKVLKTQYILKVINKIDQGVRMIGIIFPHNLDRSKESLMMFKQGEDRSIILGMAQIKMERMLLQTIYFLLKLVRLIEIDLYQKEGFLHLIMD